MIESVEKNSRNGQPCPICKGAASEEGEVEANVKCLGTDNGVTEEGNKQIGLRSGGIVHPPC